MRLQHLFRLKLQRALILPTALVATFANAQPGTDVPSTCAAAYEKTGPILRDILGEAKDEKLASAAEGFLVDYSRHAKDVPSYETYMERLEKNKFKGDRDAAYAFMQRFSRENDEQAFQKIMSLIASLEKLAGRSSGLSKPLDEGALAYTKCLRDAMSKRIRDLPENPYYEFKRSDLLRRIEPTTSSSTALSDVPDTQK